MCCDLKGGVHYASALMLCKIYSNWSQKYLFTPQTISFPSMAHYFIFFNSESIKFNLFEVLHLFDIRTKVFKYFYFHKMSFIFQLNIIVNE